MNNFINYAFIRIVVDVACLFPTSVYYLLSVKKKKEEKKFTHSLSRLLMYLDSV